jgi:hypothetical protein
MTNQILTLFLIFSISCFGNNRQKYADSDINLFSKYLKTFRARNLPFELDRIGVMKLKNEKEDSSIVDEAYYEYIPEGIKNDNPENPSSYRSLYLLPKLDDNIIVLLVQDVFVENPMYSAVKIYMIVYDQGGNIIDYKELAMFQPDISEAFVKISNTYEIEKRRYQFKMNTSKEYSSLAHVIETKFEYKINLNGNIEELLKSKTEGYYEPVLSGYNLIKQVK